MSVVIVRKLHCRKICVYLMETLRVFDAGVLHTESSHLCNRNSNFEIFSNRSAPPNISTKLSRMYKICLHV